MAASNTIARQLKRNAVAIISLIIAIASFSYNTWRNEQSESNRNQRFASFEILLKLNQLQQLIFHRRYDPELVIKGNARTGWTYVLTINDLAQIMPHPLPQSAQSLLDSWQNNWQFIDQNQASADKILVTVDSMRDQTINLIKSLE